MKLRKYYENFAGEILPADDLPANAKYHRFILREEFVHYYIDENYSRKDMAKLGVGTKVFQTTYHRHFPDPAERERIRARKLSRSRVGNKHGQAKNKHKLMGSHIVPRDELARLLDECTPLTQLCLHFGMSEPTINKNLEYHGLHHYTKTTNLHGTTYLALQDMERLTGIDLTRHFSSSDERDNNLLRQEVFLAEQAVQKCKETLAALRHQYGLGASSIPQSRYERAVIQFCLDNSIEFIPQHPIGKFNYDIYLPAFNLLIEVDGAGHNSTTDAAKNEAAAQQGIPLLRMEFTKWTSKKIVSEKVRSALSAALENRGFGTFR